MRNALILLYFMSVFVVFQICFISTSKAQETILDGTYDAEVTTDSGTYSVPVEVEDGEVTGVQWPNGGTMSVTGAAVEDGEAQGSNSKGDSVSIEIDDPEYDDDQDEMEGSEDD
jgi:hypothetical protein